MPMAPKSVLVPQVFSENAYLLYVKFTFFDNLEMPNLFPYVPQALSKTSLLPKLVLDSA